MEQEKNITKHTGGHKLHESKLVHGVIVGIAIVVVMLIVFKAGEYVGFRKASFSYELGDNYYRTFGGERIGEETGMMPMMGGFFHDDVPGGHGVTGKVIKVSPTTVVVEGTDNIEKIITINDDTLIRQFREMASTTALQVNDSVIVIGSPGQNGDIVAKLIRIIPKP